MEKTRSEKSEISHLQDQEPRKKSYFSFSFKLQLALFKTILFLLLYWIRMMCNLHCLCGNLCCMVVDPVRRTILFVNHSSCPDPLALRTEPINLPQHRWSYVGGLQPTIWFRLRSWTHNLADSSPFVISSESEQNNNKLNKQWFLLVWNDFIKEGNPTIIMHPRNSPQLFFLAS